MQSDMMRIFHQHAFNLLWLGWAIYWFVAAIGARRTRYREPAAASLLHLVPLVLGAGLFIWPHPGRGWLTWRYLPPAPVWFFLGLLLTVLGLGLAVYARAFLGRNWSGTVTLKQDHELIRSGPYRWVRHPIYTGLLLAVCASALALGQLRGLLGLALIAAGFLRRITVEERILTGQFGDAYKRYQAEVPALVPGVY
jgi:protein-S-isoprenylcysteine O-methyltransferase Ste14